MPGATESSAIFGSSVAANFPAPLPEGYSIEVVEATKERVVARMGNRGVTSRPNI